MPIENPFEMPLLVDDIEEGEDIAREVSEAAYDLRDQDPSGRLISHKFRDLATATSKDDFDKHGYTSHGSFNLQADKRFHRVHKATVSQMEKYMTYMKAGYEFRLSSSWVSIYGNGSFAPEHTHPLCHLSCVFYGAVTEGTGEIVFKNPAMETYNMLYGNGINVYCDLYTIQPKVGQMIIFPSFMRHYTKPHLSDDDRIIFSCNAVIERVFT